MSPRTVPFVRTVLGDLPAQDLGVCYAHEHIVIDPCYATQTEPDFLLDDADAAIRELAVFRAAGGRAVIDAMPCDCGRNAEKLAAVSRASGVSIVAPTGLHLRKYYPDGHWAGRMSAEELAALFSADIAEGIDANDYGGPQVRRTAVRAGVIKIAGGKDRLSPYERTVFRAAALAQVATGCPVLTHTEQGTAAAEQIEVLRENGADLSRVTLSHCDRLPDPQLHRELLRSGVKMEYDSCFRWKSGPNHTLNLLVELLPEFPGQLMLGMDAARRSYWSAYGGKPGLAFLLTEFSAQLRAAGIGAELLERVFVHTPAEAYSFSPRYLA
jgi:phosphotriesterase-related protein